LTRQLEELGRLDTRSAADFARQSQTTGTTPSGNEILGALLRDAEHAVAAFVPADKQDAILMLLRLDRALLELFAVRGRNMTGVSHCQGQGRPYRDPSNRRLRRD